MKSGKWTWTIGAVLLLLPVIAAAQVCTITGTLYKSTGAVAANQIVTVSEVRTLGGVLISAQVQTYRTTANGQVRLRIMKNSTAYVWADAMGMRGDNGKGAFVVVPNSDTATLENLLSTTVIYALNAGSVTGVTVQLLTDSLNANPRHIGRDEFTDSLDAHIPRSAGGVVDQTARDTASAARLRAETAVTLANAAGSTAATATNIANGKAGADSVHTALVTLNNIAAGKAGADSVSLQIKAVKDIAGGKGDSDSLSTTYGTAATALANAGLALQRARMDSVISQGGNLDVSGAGEQPDVIIFTGFGHLNLGQVANQKFGKSYTILNRSGGNVFFDYYGTGEDPDGASGYDTIPNLSWQRVVSNGTAWAVQRSDVSLAKLTATIKDSIDAKVTRGATLPLAAVDDSLSALVTAGDRSISTTGRIFAADDSITFAGEAGDVINAALGNVFRGTLGAADTLSVTGMVDGQSITVIITQGNNYALGWSGIAWSGGTAPTLTATANKRDVFTLIRAGGVVYGSYVQNF